MRERDYKPPQKLVKEEKEMELSSGYGSYLYLGMFPPQCIKLFFEVYCECDLKDGY